MCLLMEELNCSEGGFAISHIPHSKLFQKHPFHATFSSVIVFSPFSATAYSDHACNCSWAPIESLWQTKEGNKQLEKLLIFLVSFPS